MTAALIAAMADGGVIGNKGELPWHLPADLARFRRLTMGHNLIVGRKTWESIGRPLPGRRMIVVSRQRELSIEGARVVGSIDEAIEAAAGDTEPFIGGGAEIYRQALPIANRIYLTRVHTRIIGDTYFPNFDPSAWTLVRREETPADEQNRFAQSFLVYERRQGASLI